jgi:hypothetical protein
MKKRTALQHGECLMLPVDIMPEGDIKKVKAQIIAHSETGHHHVVEATKVFEVTGNIDKEDLYLRLFEPAKLVHKKLTSKHKTLTVPAGVWKILHKTEYNPFAGLIQRVKD